MMNSSPCTVTTEAGTLRSEALSRRGKSSMDVPTTSPLSQAGSASRCVPGGAGGCDSKSRLTPQYDRAQSSCTGDGK